ncbi:MAG TPA: hypothetical protein VGE25_10975 [Sediminibacterium sp.]
MTQESYILYIEQSSMGDLEVTLSILNIAGIGYSLHGSSSDTGCASLWLIYSGKNNPEEIKKQLEKIPPIKKVTVITISNPMKESEIADLRAVFLKIGWDATAISTEELSMFLNDQLQGQKTHYIDFDHKKMWRHPVKIKIKPLQEHPNFSQDWLQETHFKLQDLTDKEITKDDIKIEIIEVTRIIDVQTKHTRK